MNTLNIKYIDEDIAFKLNEGSSRVEVFKYLNNYKGQLYLSILKDRLPHYDFYLNESWGGKIIIAEKKD